MSLKVLDPTLGPEAETARLAPPLGSLEGATVGLIDNAKVNVAQFYDHVEEILRTQYGVKEFIRRRKPDTSRPVPLAMLSELQGCDAIISAIGDWGSCSSCSLHDALAAEKLGIPATAVITDRFEQTARAMAELNGMADYPFAIIEHPISDNADDVLRAKAEVAVRQIVPLLKERAREVAVSS